MADMYGSINVDFSENFKGNLNGLACALNKLNLVNDPSEFESDGNTIWLNSRKVQDPTLSPTHPVLFELETECGMVEKSIEEMTEADWNDVCDETGYEIIPLDKVSKQISAHITSGSIFLYCHGTMKHYFRMSEYLRVDADGTVSRFAFEHTDGYEPEHRVEFC